MFDFGSGLFTSPRAFPLGAILFDFLFLLVAIPIEAYILHTRLKFDKRTSVFYSICMNLFSAVIGWVVFFFTERLLPAEMRSELISYFFFNTFLSSNMSSLIIVTALTIFFGTLLVKFILLKILIIAMSEATKKQPEPEPAVKRGLRRIYKFKLQNSNLVTAVLIANSLSYSAITIIILFKAVNIFG